MIGKGLVERVQTELARRGCGILIVDVWHAAEPFYRSLGWEPPDVVLLRRTLDGGNLLVGHSSVVYNSRYSWSFVAYGRKSAPHPRANRET